MGGATFGSRLVDSRSARVARAPREAFEPVRRIGGETGWYYGNWLWRLRGFLDLLVGGVGVRRGRRDPERLVPGDALDFWRVEAVEPDALLRLSAEMKLPGRAWLQFEVEPDGDGSLLRQTAIFDPRGLLGLAYWYALYPLHLLVFAGMLRGIVEAIPGGPTSENRSHPTRSSASRTPPPTSSETPSRSAGSSTSTGSQAVLYRSRMNPSLGRNFEAMDPLEWLARLSDHIPDPGQHRTLFYGEYSNRVRGSGHPGEPEAPSRDEPTPRKRCPPNWARLIAKVYQADPLLGRWRLAAGPSMPHGPQGSRAFRSRHLPVFVLPAGGVTPSRRSFP